MVLALLEFSWDGRNTFLCLTMWTEHFVFLRSIMAGDGATWELGPETRFTALRWLGFLSRETFVIYDMVEL